MMPFRHALMAALLTAAAGCGDPDPDTTFLARAGGSQLTVEDAAQLLAPVEGMETPRRAALTLANLWVDYTLLATAAARGDDFAHLDLEGVVEQRMELAMAAALSDSGFARS
jgi:type IV pilus biogenesis protein CpaD/CtpE